jgi:hypothetical protein
MRMMEGEPEEAIQHPDAERGLNGILNTQSTWQDRGWIELRQNLAMSRKKFSGRIARFMYEFMPAVHQSLKMGEFNENTESYNELARDQANALETIQTNLDNHNDITREEKENIVKDYKDELLKAIAEYLRRSFPEIKFETNSQQWKKIEREYSRLFDFFASNDEKPTLQTKK